VHVEIVRRLSLPSSLLGLLGNRLFLRLLLAKDSVPIV